MKRPISIGLVAHLVPAFALTGEFCAQADPASDGEENETAPGGDPVAQTADPDGKS